MTTEQKQAISRANAGAGMTRREIAERALARAEAEVVACQQRLRDAIMNEEKNAGKHEARKEKTTKRMLAQLTADESLREQARRILASLGDSVTIAG